MSMSIFNNSTPISLREREDRRNKDEKMGLGRLTGARVDDGLERAAGLPTITPPTSDKKVPEASAAQASSDFSRDYIASQPEAAIGAQANQNQRSAMRLLQQQP